MNKDFIYNGQIFYIVHDTYQKHKQDFMNMQVITRSSENISNLFF